MDKAVRILAINPGSTSTKIGVFEDDRELLSMNVSHDAGELGKFPEIQDQLLYRKKTVEAELEAAGIPLQSIQVFVGRGGGLVPIQGGTYEVNERLIRDASTAASGAHHPAQLASQICALYRDEYGGRAFVVNPPDVDEYCELARYTGLGGLHRASHVHALNHKEVALRYCKERGISYWDSNLIVCHIGGGISVAAHRQGSMIDSNDLLGGEGPMMPTRAGALPAVPLVKLCFSGKYTEKELIMRINKTGGLIDHLGTADVIEVERRIEEGDAQAKTVFEAMVYQIAKAVGACACALQGSVNAILLTGGISHSERMTGMLRQYVEWIAPVSVLAGEFEMEALAAGALRVVAGEEEPMEYTGEPVWTAPQFQAVGMHSVAQ